MLCSLSRSKSRPPSAAPRASAGDRSLPAGSGARADGSGGCGTGALSAGRAPHTSHRELRPGAGTAGGACGPELCLCACSAAPAPATAADPAAAPPGTAPVCGSGGGEPPRAPLAPSGSVRSTAARASLSRSCCGLLLPGCSLPANIGSASPHGCSPPSDCPLSTILTSTGSAATCLHGRDATAVSCVGVGCE